jgi:hypothetical protein
VWYDPHQHTGCMRFYKRNIMTHQWHSLRFTAVKSSQHNSSALQYMMCQIRYAIARACIAVQLSCPEQLAQLLLSAVEAHRHKT